MNRQHGFTLIELMIVVAIVAIIASVAYPSYQAQVLKTRRADAHASLTDISARLERDVAQRGNYANDFGPTELGLENTTGATSTLSNDGFYTITFALDVTDATTCGTNTCPYVITATAVAPQDQDTQCATITLSSIGFKSGTTAGDACW